MLKVTFDPWTVEKYNNNNSRSYFSNRMKTFLTSKYKHINNQSYFNTKICSRPFLIQSKF